MKILLLSSCFEEITLITASCKKSAGIKTSDDSHYPLGIGYLHSYLASRGYTVKSLFLNNYDFDRCFATVRDEIDEFRPDCVGFQVITPNRVSTYRLMEYIHEKHPHIRLVAGGIHATIMYKQLIEKYPFVTVVLGEGEVTLCELIAKFEEEKSDLTSVDGIAFFHNGSVVKTDPREPIEDLDCLPFPNHEQYFGKGRQRGALLTSRGCPFTCSFCSLNSISGRKVRYRSVKNVVDEIEYMVNTFPTLSHLWIHDDNFFNNNQRVIEICDEILRRNIHIEFTCSGRIKPISPELVSMLEQANCKKVLLGLESGSNEILKKAHKGISKDDVLNTFRLFADSKIELYAFLIVGLPGETLNTIIETSKFVQKLQKLKYVHYFDNIAILTIYPGSEIYQIANTNKMIEDDIWLTDQPCPLFTVENSTEQLLEFKEILMNYICLDRFYTRKGFILQFSMIPFIIKYFFQYRMKYLVKGFLSKLLKATLPNNIHERLIRCYRLIRDRRQYE